MKTIVCESPGRFLRTETTVPTIADGHALVRIKRIGVCGTDLHAFRGRQPFFSYPRILGHELSGTVEEITINEAGIKVGDLVSVIPYLECGNCPPCLSGKSNCCINLQVLGVHIDGGMREYISVPIDHLIKADGLSPDAAAIVECLSIGAHAVRRAQLQSFEQVLIIGAGPIGLGVMRYARLSGASVTAMDVNAERLEFCRNWADVANTITADGDVEGKLRGILKGNLPDVVFDATGNKMSMESSFRLTGHGGRLLYVGLVKDSVTFDDPQFHAKELTLMSSRNATREDFENVMCSMRSGQIDTGAFITHRVHFDGMIDVFDHWLDPLSRVIKAVIELD